MAKDYTLKIRLSRSEQRAIAKAARSMGLKTSSWARATLVVLALRGPEAQRASVALLGDRGATPVDEAKSPARPTIRQRLTKSFDPDAA